MKVLAGDSNYDGHMDWAQGGNVRTPGHHCSTAGHKIQFTVSCHITMLSQYNHDLQTHEQVWDKLWSIVASYDKTMAYPPFCDFDVSMSVFTTALCPCPLSLMSSNTLTDSATQCWPACSSSSHRCTAWCTDHLRQEICQCDFLGFCNLPVSV